MGEKKKTAHKALYRKYRSKSLSEIVGQEHITKTLENALKLGKLSHAYLFTGPRGTGKTSIARILAHEINNIPYEDESIDLDIVEIDAASNRRIDDIRDLRDKVHIAPVSAKYKVYIIDEVHMLTSESFNALLKTLEEPPEHVIFILATTEVHKLPATIISRTQRYSFHLVPTQKVARHLKYIAKQEGIKIDDEALTLLAEHGGGSFRDSISLLDQLSSHTEPITTELVELLLGLAPHQALKELLDVTFLGNGTEIINSIERLVESGLTPAAIAVQLLNMVRAEIRAGESNDRSVKLMSELLSVQSAQYPELKLETVLLSVAPPRAPKAVAVVPEKEIPAPAQEVSSAKAMPEPIETRSKALEIETPVVKPKVTDSPKLAQEEAVSQSTKANPQTGDIIGQWPQILEQTKQKNNPLYTVIRLATPEVDSGGLLLIFSFPFHQKKVEESRYKALIAEIVASVTGTSVVVRSIVDKKRAKPVTTNDATPSDPAHASLISSVQDIMGGGEIVNV